MIAAANRFTHVILSAPPVYRQGRMIEEAGDCTDESPPRAATG